MLGLTRSLRHRQALGEQVDDIVPGSLRAQTERHEVSRLTRALIRSLEGQAATPDELQDGWEVRTDGIRRSIRHLLAEGLGEGGSYREVEATGSASKVARTGRRYGRKLSQLGE
ncbi:hypothetical protein [Streptomyces sp. AS02]|uniref:hypothetical protein n=1 Tax=Streptomyces sp. AS02 TaxID=2938946 RepID=UPI002020C302|nr:hypothetical protein [Streptomyces sp. AS02]MCL8011317.1 hypothetical protein [Streptomyces sp. AS02]